MNERRARLSNGELYPMPGIIQIQNVLATANFLKVGQISHLTAPSLYSEKTKTLIRKNTYIPMFTAAVFATAKTWKQPNVH